MRKTVSIFGLTLIIALIAICMVFAFSGCQKEEVEAVQYTPYVHYEEDRQMDFGRSGAHPVFYKNSISVDSFLYNQPRSQTLFNKHRINQVKVTKLSGSANIGGVIHSIYDVVIFYKDNTKDTIFSAYMAGTQASFTYVPTGESLIHISSLAKWINIRNYGNLNDYGDFYYAKNKKYYTYKIRHNGGSFFDAKMPGSKENSNVWVANHN